jgi:hypothetical protein
VIFAVGWEPRGDVARLRMRGLSGRGIAKELGIPSSTVFRLLANSTPSCDGGDDFELIGRGASCTGRSGRGN